MSATERVGLLGEDREALHGQGQLHMLRLGANQKWGSAGYSKYMGAVEGMRSKTKREVPRPPRHSFAMYA